MTQLKSINLNLSEKLQNKSYRSEFFQGLTQDQIAQQIRDLRLGRGLKQSELAKLVGTTQSAISRLEQAEYSSWGFKTLMGVAEALDAHARFVLEPAEVVIKHYARLEAESNAASVEGILGNQSSPMTRTTNEVVEITIDTPASDMPAS